jgi:glycosyltransferase involved in cell wall biosynthesis
MMKLFKISDVIYWVIGGDFPHLINCELISTEPYANARVIIVEGKRMEETLRIYGLDNAITLPNFKPIDFVPTKKPRNANTPVRFVFLSRIIEDKGCAYINKAAEILNAKGLESRFSVDYYGSITENYKQRFLDEVKKVPNVEYKGFLKLVERSNYDVLAGYDAMLFPTFFYGEGFAGIFIDAFIAGLPVIATDWNLNSEIIKDGETGIIVENRNADKLADAMERLIRNPQEIEVMAKNCQARCMDFESDNVVTESLMKKIGLKE